GNLLQDDCSINGAFYTSTIGKCKLNGTRRLETVVACQNNATCVRTGQNIDDFYCCCQEGFMGDRCQTEIDECASGPCQNNGTCKDLLKSYECDCLNGFIGVNCQLQVNESQAVCDLNNCQNNSTC
ncbi:unnamed protein product, partial [Owenia fusiformis]